MVFIWNMETGHAETTPDVHADIITDVRFQSNSTLLATSSLDETIKIWDASKTLGTKKRICELRSDYGDKFFSCVFHPRVPDYLIVGSYKSLKLWKWVENTGNYLPTHEDRISALADSPSRGIIASGSFDNTIKIWK
ncbi:hypothetical protein CARUB_v10021127mg [Capsella rubella]|uniref:Uncharacterized protein n=1 Tax=Capsella rubella TaxID=81985 RepID=R0GJ15_9BRAS|nr:hypothetical protein CARUB_v10021127mg [Capsella rubella]